jgi:hypothetical protein
MPKKPEDLKQFFAGIWNLRELEKSEEYEPRTLNYMNHIPDDIGFVKKETNCECDENNIDTNVIETTLQNLDSSKEFGRNNSLYHYYIKKLRDICPKPDKSKGKSRKKKLGIYENIPERNKDPDEQYRAINLDPPIYFDKPESPIFIKFNNYLGYLAYLNSKYTSGKSNYIVLGATSGAIKMQSVKVKIIKENREAFVNVVGIQNVLKICFQSQEKNFNSLAEVFKQAKKLFFKQLVFSRNINNSSISEGLDLTKEQSKKVYFYLKTLSDVVKAINESNVSIDATHDKNIIELLNAHGLLCSPEDEETMKYGYLAFNCRKRTFDNGTGKNILYNFHLKPLTNHKSGCHDSEHTVRIYFVWNDKLKRICIGWIGPHLPGCAKKDDKGNFTLSDCEIKDCANNPLSHYTEGKID